jgi:hypothetical protein
LQAHCLVRLLLLAAEFPLITLSLPVAAAVVVTWVVAVARADI